MTNQVLLWVKQRWRLICTLLIPLVLLPLPIAVQNSQARCGYVVLILASFWVFEILPLPVTSLLPLILFPMAGVLKAEDVAPQYFKDIIALFFGSLTFAYAIESVNLHRRIALFVLSIVGTSIKWTMAGLMLVTAFLSMWINNSAAASIMLPVAKAIINELEDKEPDQPECFVVALDSSENDQLNKTTTVDVKKRFQWPWTTKKHINKTKSSKEKLEDLRKAFLLATAYSATLGGLSSLVGTGPNVLVKGFADEEYKDTEFRINFLNFLLFALPVAVLMLIICWVWLQLIYNRDELFRCRSDPNTWESRSRLKALLVKQYKDLGKPKWSEYSVGVIFIVMILLWVTREFGDVQGWNAIFVKDYITDATVAVFCGTLTLIVPNQNPFQKNWKYEPIVNWSDLVKNISWSAVFLLGAGLSVASAFTASKLSESVAQALRFLGGVPREAVIIAVIVISGLFTEVTSNLSTASIFLPVLDSVARTSHIHPGFLILPCTLAVSLAFMLPIATPPNAIVFSGGSLRVFDMVKTGIVMNIVGFLIVFFASTTWMPKIFGLDDESASIFFNKTTTIAPRL